MNNRDVFFGSGMDMKWYVMRIKDDIASVAKERKAISGDVIQVSGIRCDLYPDELSDYVVVINARSVCVKHDYDVLESMLAMEKL